MKWILFEDMCRMIDNKVQNTDVLANKEERHRFMYYLDLWRSECELQEGRLNREEKRNAREEDCKEDV